MAIITKGVFQAIWLAIEALNEDPQDPLRVESALNHLEWICAIQMLCESQSQGETK